MATRRRTPPVAWPRPLAGHGVLSCSVPEAHAVWVFWNGPDGARRLVRQLQARSFARPSVSTRRITSSTSSSIRMEPGSGRTRRNSTGWIDLGRWTRSGGRSDPGRGSASRRRARRRPTLVERRLGALGARPAPGRCPSYRPVGRTRDRRGLARRASRPGVARAGLPDRGGVAGARSRSGCRAGRRDAARGREGEASASRATTGSSRPPVRRATSLCLARPVARTRSTSSGATAASSTGTSTSSSRCAGRRSASTPSTRSST